MDIPLRTWPQLRPKISHPTVLTAASSPIHSQPSQLVGVQAKIEAVGNPWVAVSLYSQRKKPFGSSAKAGRGSSGCWSPPHHPGAARMHSPTKMKRKQRNMAKPTPFTQVAPEPRSYEKPVMNHLCPKVTLSKKFQNSFEIAAK
jgi:hypothetical protein